MLIEKDTLIGEALKANPKATETFMNYGMGCLSCPSSQLESLEQASIVHGINLNELLKELNQSNV